MADIYDLFEDDDKKQEKNKKERKNLKNPNSLNAAEENDTATVHDLFDNDENNDSGKRVHRTASEVVDFIVKKTKEMMTQEEEIKRAMIENGLKLYRVATMDVDMSESEMIYNDIPAFLYTPFIQTIGKANERHYYLFDEKAGDAVYSLTLFSETKLIGSNQMASGIAIEVVKKEGDKAYVFNPAVKKWELISETEEKEQSDKFSEEAINKLLSSIFDETRSSGETNLSNSFLDEDYPYDTEYKKSVYTKNRPETYLLEKLADWRTSFSDEEYKKIFREQEALLKLYERVSESMEFMPDLLRDDNYKILLVPRDENHIGFAIAAKDDYYEILQFISEDEAAVIHEADDYQEDAYIYSIGRTKSVNVVLKFIRAAFEAKRGMKRAITIPLSTKSLMCVCGENVKEICTAIKERTDNNMYSEEELKNIFLFVRGITNK